MGFHQAFAPHKKANQTITAITTSTSVSIDPTPMSVRVVNDGVEMVFVCVGFDSITATPTDCPVRADSEIIIHKGVGANAVAVICPSGTSTVYIQTGEGGI